MIRFDATIWNGKYGIKDQKDLNLKGNDQHGLFAYLLYDKDKLIMCDKEEDDTLVLIAQILVAMVDKDKEHKCISQKLGNEITNLQSKVSTIKKCKDTAKYKETKYLFKALLWQDLQDLAPKLSDELLDVVFTNLDGRLKDFMYHSDVYEEPEEYFDDWIQGRDME